MAKLEIKQKTTEKEPEGGCKGLFWRARVSQYVSSHRSIEHRKSLRLLKRMSCPGCEKCDWAWEYIPEDLSNTEEFLNGIEDGKIYKYKIHVSRDYETGFDDVDFSEFVEVKQED